MFKETVMGSKVLIEKEQFAAATISKLNEHSKATKIHLMTS